MTDHQWAAPDDTIPLPQRDHEWDRTVDDAQDTSLDVRRGSEGWKFTDDDDDVDEAMARHPAGSGRTHPHPFGAPTILDMSEELEGA